MKTMYLYEMKKGIKSLLIWSLAVGLMGLFCILLFSGMEEQMADMAGSFSDLGAFSDAFGMSTLSIATLEGFFATEVGTIHALGSCMFAASLGITLLSKEEDGHTAEFTFTLPLSRSKVLTAKLCAMICHLVLFTLLCGGLYWCGILAVGEEMDFNKFVVYMASQFFMNLEVAGICFLFSALNRKNKMGLGIGLALTLYVYDLMARVVPDLKDTQFLTPFAFSNASEIFSNTLEPERALAFGSLLLVGSLMAAYAIYLKRDLAS